MKLKINMLSQAEKVEGQGVASAYIEQMNLLQNPPIEDIDIFINKKKIKTDIIHFHTVNPTYYLKSIFTKSKKVVSVHFIPNTLDGSLKLPAPIFFIFKKYVLSFYKKADQIVVVNPTFIDELVALKIKKEKITYIPNYVNKSDFYVSNNIDYLKDKYNIPKDRFIVLGVGQLQVRKGIFDFVEVAKQMPHITFVWAGGFSFGKITDGYKEIKKIKENPPDNIIFLDIIPREQMNDIYNIADILFMPSFNELFPMAILEAVNLHKPILLRDLYLYEEILFKKYAKGNDITEFISEIEKLNSDKNYYSLNSNYSKDISDYYSQEHIRKLWIDYYKSIVE